LNVKRKKSIIKKTVNRVVVKEVKNIFITLKKDLFWGVLDIEEIRDKDNETGLKEGEGTEMSTTVLFHIRDARSLRFEYSPMDNPA